MSEANQQFDTFEEWVNKAPHWLTRHADYNDTEHGVRGWRGHHFTAICFDAKGTRCRIGKDFEAAHFPVRWVWPDQVIELVLMLRKEIENGN